MKRLLLEDVSPGGFTISLTPIMRRTKAASETLGNQGRSHVIYMDPPEDNCANGKHGIGFPVSIANAQSINSQLRKYRTSY